MRLNYEISRYEQRQQKFNLLLYIFKSAKEMNASQLIYCERSGVHHHDLL